MGVTCSVLALIHLGKKQHTPQQPQSLKSTDPSDARNEDMPHHNSRVLSEEGQKQKAKSMITILLLNLGMLIWIILLITKREIENDNSLSKFRFY